MTRAVDHTGFNLVNPDGPALLAQSQMTGLRHPNTMAFIERQLIPWLRRKPDLSVPVGPFEAEALQDELPWIRGALQRGDRLGRFVASIEIVRDLANLRTLLRDLERVAAAKDPLDGFRAQAERRLRRLDANRVEDLLAFHDDWFERRAKRSLRKAAAEFGSAAPDAAHPERVTADERRFWVPIPPAWLRKAGQKLRNCLASGHYLPEVTRGEMEIWGLFEGVADDDSLLGVMRLTKTPSGWAHSEHQFVRGFQPDRDMAHLALARRIPWDAFELGVIRGVPISDFESYPVSCGGDLLLHESDLIGRTSSGKLMRLAGTERGSGGRLTLHIAHSADEVEERDTASQFLASVVRGGKGDKALLRDLLMQALARTPKRRFATNGWDNLTYHPPHIGAELLICEGDVVDLDAITPLLRIRDGGHDLEAHHTGSHLLLRLRTSRGWKMSAIGDWRHNPMSATAFERLVNLLDEGTQIPRTKFSTCAASRLRIQSVRCAVSPSGLASLVMPSWLSTLYNSNCALVSQHGILVDGAWETAAIGPDIRVIRPMVGEQAPDLEVAPPGTFDQINDVARITVEVLPTERNRKSSTYYSSDGKVSAARASAGGEHLVVEMKVDFNRNHPWRLGKNISLADPDTFAPLAVSGHRVSEQLSPARARLAMAIEAKTGGHLGDMALVRLALERLPSGDLTTVEPSTALKDGTPVRRDARRLVVFRPDGSPLVTLPLRGGVGLIGGPFWHPRSGDERRPPTDEDVNLLARAAAELAVKFPKSFDSHDVGARKGLSRQLERLGWTLLSGVPFRAAGVHIPPFDLEVAGATYRVTQTSLTASLPWHLRDLVDKTDRRVFEVTPLSDLEGRPIDQLDDWARWRHAGALFVSADRELDLGLDRKQEQPYFDWAPVATEVARILAPKLGIGVSGRALGAFPVRVGQDGLPHLLPLDHPVRSGRLVTPIGTWVADRPEWEGEAAGSPRTSWHLRTEEGQKIAVRLAPHSGRPSAVSPFCGKAALAILPDVEVPLEEIRRAVLDLEAHLEPS